MKRWLMLKWHRFWLKKHYFMKRSMEESATCGVHLLENISSEYSHAKRMVNYHYDKCQELEGAK